MTTFDPWRLEGDTGSVSDLEYVSESLMARARKRVVREVETGGWRVSSLSGEQFDSYGVIQAGVKYECECYHTNYGDSRRRKMCSHVLAVVLHRRKMGYENGSPVKSTGANTDTIEGRSLELGNATGTTTGLRLNGSGSGGQETEPLLIPAATFNNDIPTVDDPIWGVGGLPDWCGEIRPHQWEAVQGVLEAYESGAKVVWLDAPTGAGKTLIGELVRRMLQVKSLYVCSSKTLQKQFLMDYRYAHLLMGRGNYPTQLMPPPYTAGDCMGPGCGWCDEMDECPYQVAKRKAVRGDVAVLNTAYFLAEGNYVGEVAGKAEFVVMDECDVLERELMGFVEFRIGDRMLKDLKVAAPKKGSHKTTISEWMAGELVTAISAAGRDIPQAMNELERLRYRKRLGELRQKAAMVAEEVAGDEWIRDNDAGPLVMRPVKVGGYGERYLWRHGEKWLNMSATIISPDELCDSLGLDQGECRLVRVPMTFPVENRRIHVAPVANMVAKEKETEWPKLAQAVRRIMEMHPSERILVHTVSYDLAKYLTGQLRNTRRIVTYTRAEDRDEALARFRQSECGVLLASSMDRGVDLKGDECRVVVVAKVPFPYLGDKQVSARMHMENGQAWYNVQAIRSLVQMTGRAVRSKDDWCTTYILDKQFVGNLYRRNKGLFPKWWTEALDMGFNVRSLH